MNESETESRRDSILAVLIPVGLVVVWCVLQAWVLPSIGVKT